MIRKNPLQKNPKSLKDFWMFRAPIQLKEQLDKIILERIKKGKDNFPRSYNRLGLAIARHEKFIQDLINADFVEDEK